MYIMYNNTYDIKIDLSYKANSVHNTLIREYGTNFLLSVNAIEIITTL